MVLKLVLEEGVSVMLDVNAVEELLLFEAAVAIEGVFHVLSLLVMELYGEPGGNLLAAVAGVSDSVE